MKSGGDELVVTGIGIVSPIGHDAQATMKALLRGESGIELLPQEQRHLTPVYLHAPVDAGGLASIGQREARRLDRSVQFALQAAREAWADAGRPDVEPVRLATIVSTGMGGLLTVLKEHERYLERGHVGLPAHIVPAIMANASSASVAIEIGAHAGALATATACASGADAIAQALQLFRDDEIDVAVVGGTEAVIHPVTLSSFAALRALSARHDDPAAASRPFDRDRDGFVLGEGAGVLVVESRRHAAARAAHVWGRLLSAARTCDASHIVVPEPTGRWSAEAMSRALRRAGVGASDVTFVSAHATATPHGDLAEFKALQTALGSSLPGVCVTAVKSALGHLIGASGAVATALAIMSLHDGAVPPTLNVDHLDPQIELDVVRNSPRVLSGSGTALINSFGFGGHNVAVVAAAA